MQGLELCNVTKEYNEAARPLKVLDNVSFKFPSSGSFSIVGRSGVGKSTLLHILGGLDRPRSGNVVFDGVALDALGADDLAALRSQKVGFIFQFHHLLPEFNALENVAMPLIIAGEPETEALERSRQALSRVGLEDRVDHRPGELSGGEQQRVAIARAVAAKPRLILADEPTGNLDVQTAKSVQTLLCEVQRELSCLLIVVTHSLELAACMDKNIEMRGGGQLSLVGATAF